MVPDLMNVGKEHFLNKLILPKGRRGIFSMEWVTVYIAGKPGFEEDVLKNLEGSRFPYMPGTSENNSLCLFWMDERASLKEFKKAIGSKTVFKYRLQFFPSLEKYHESKRERPDSLSPQEQAMIYQMASWDVSQRNYQRSA
jgi:hypothetical protein